MSEIKYMGSTKKDIWDAYKALKKEVDAKQSASKVTTTTSAAEEAKLTKAVAHAGEVNMDAVSATIQEFIEKVGEVKEQYSSILTAIDAKKKELQEIHDLEAEANSLITVVATKDKLVAEKTEQAQKVVAEAKEEAETILTEAQDRAVKITESAHEDAQKIRDEIAEEKAQTEKMRAREQEEYAYDFNRKKKADEDTLKDELDAKVKVIVEREEAVAEREAKADELDKKVADLTAEIESINKNIDNKIEKAVAEAKEKADKSASIAKAMLSKDYDAQISIKDARIETLEEKVKELAEQLAKAQAQVSDANNKVSEMAKSALKAQADADTITRVSEIAASGSNKR
jgi:chromosome segregation ATPase